jgi:hypothetical protein
MTSAKIFEEDVAQTSPASVYLDGLGDLGAVALVIPDIRPQAPSPVIGADAVEFMALLRDHESDQFSVGICGDAEDVHYSQLNSIILDIGMYLLTDVGVPLFVDVLGSYIESKIILHNSDDIQLRVEIVKGKGKSKKKYSISGNPRDVMKAVKELDKK